MPDQPDRTYTPAEAAKQLGITRRWMYHLCREGHVATIRFQVTGRIKIPQAEIDRLKTPRKR